MNERTFSPLHGFAPVFGWGLGRIVRWPKVIVVAAVASGFGILVGSQIAGQEDSAKALATILDRGVLTVGLPLIALFLAGEGFAYEVQARTLVYHLVRPVRRRTLFVARFLSGFLPAALVSMLLLGSLIAASGVPMPSGAWWTVPVTGALGAFALSAIYYTLGAVFRYGFVIGLIYTFVVEAFVSTLPGSMQQLSVMYHVRGVHHRLTEGVLPEAAVLTDESLIPDMLRRGATEDASLLTSVLVLLVFSAVVLAVGMWHTARRDFALKD